MIEPLTKLEPGMPILFGGNSMTRVTKELAAAFREGDRLIVVQETGDLLHIPLAEWRIATDAVEAASASFAVMGDVSDSQVTDFYRRFASHLQDEDVFAPIAEANELDVEKARERGRPTGRLVLSTRMRRDMIQGLLLWAASETGRGEVIDTVTHRGWTLEQVRAGLGVVGFVFEGRPNVFADATGVLRGGNTVVFRIGSDALNTARAMVRHALAPALEESGLPPASVSLVDSASRASGWALFANPRLGLAVARGSGMAVSQLGAVARQAGVPVSLHGTGGAWMIAAESADPHDFSLAVYHSLDRKVCNTLNTVCIVADRAADLVPVFLEALERAGERHGSRPRLHVTSGTESLISTEWRSQADVISQDQLGVEWEWDDAPEVTLTVVPDVETGVRSFNTQSPRFVASLISADESEQQRFFELIDAPFVGNGFTRWVDGQYALDSPELGLSNWQFGRLFARGGILSGDSVFTIRSRVTQDDPDIGR